MDCAVIVMDAAEIRPMVDEVGSAELVTVGDDGFPIATRLPPHPAGRHSELPHGRRQPAMAQADWLLGAVTDLSDLPEQQRQMPRAVDEVGVRLRGPAAVLAPVLGPPLRGTGPGRREA